MNEKTVSLYSEVIVTDRNSRRKITSSNLGILVTESWEQRELIIDSNMDATIDGFLQMAFIVCDYPVTIEVTINSNTQTFANTRFFGVNSAIDRIKIYNNNDNIVRIKCSKV